LAAVTAYGRASWGAPVGIVHTSALMVALSFVKTIHRPSADQWLAMLGSADWYRSLS
jgi:hypothetical protein